MYCYLLLFIYLVSDSEVNYGHYKNAPYILRNVPVEGFCGDKGTPLMGSTTEIRIRNAYNKYTY